MNYLPKTDYLSLAFWQTMALELVIIILLLVLLRWLSARVAAVKSGIKELSQQDNIAFGISIAGRMLALCILFAGAAASVPERSWLDTGSYTLTAGVFGIVLILMGRWLHDKLVIGRIKELQQIGQRNNAVALVEAAAILAVAIALQESMYWGKSSLLLSTWLMLITLMSCILAFYLVTHWLVATDIQGNTLQTSLKQGHLAVAVSHSGKLLAAGLAVSTAVNLFEFNQAGQISGLVSLLLSSVIILLAITLSVQFGKRIILLGIDTQNEIELQHNVGVAAVEASLYLGFGLIWAHLLR